MQNFCKWFWMHERVKVNVRQPSVSKTATTHRASTKWQPGLMKHNQADPPKTSTNTRTCTVITLWTTSGSQLESSTKWRAFNFLESGNMYLYYISTFYGPQAHPFCRGFWRGYILIIHFGVPLFLETPIYKLVVEPTHLKNMIVNLDHFSK